MSANLLLSNANVTDPTDFNNEALARLDSSLRCPICKEFLDGPVNLNCGHSFCSLCIRDYLRTTEECPCCRARPALELHLKKNLALEESVLAWKDSRNTVLDSLRPPTSPPADFERPHKKRRLSDEDSEPTNSAASSKRPSASSSHSTSKTKFHGSSSGASLLEIIEIDDSSEPGNAPPASPAKNTVQCPACAKRLPFARLNEHLDRNCNDLPTKQPPPRLEPGQGLTGFFKARSSGTGSSKASTSKPKAKDTPREPIPKFSYDTMKLSQLRSTLSSHGLQETGSRDVLVARLEHWSKIFNANLDRREDLQHTNSSLKAELRRWEEEQEKSQGKDKATIPQDLGSYEKTHQADFSLLVAEARASQAKTRMKAVSSATIQEPQTALSPSPSVLPDSDVVIIQD